MTLSGGEPFTNPWVKQMMELYKQRTGQKINMVTSGVMDINIKEYDGLIGTLYITLKYGDFELDELWKGSLIPNAKKNIKRKSSCITI